jgi:hypothetical protein
MAGSSEMECRRIAELLEDYLEDSLPARTRALIDWHIDGCPPCVAFVNTYRGTVKVMGTLRPPDVPPELKQRLAAVLRTLRARDVAGD